MKNIVNTYAGKFRHEKRMRRRIISVLTVLAFVVSGTVFWQLRSTGVAMANETYCGMDEHTHSEEQGCWEWILTCEQSDEEGLNVKNLTEASDRGTDSDIAVSVEDEVPDTVSDPNDAEPAEEGASCTEPDSGNTRTEAEETAEAEPAPYDSGDCEGEISDTASETARHTHDESCYMSVLVCEVPEHTHTVECLIDETADVETAEIWEAALPELTGIWADDVVAVARSQTGYVESEKNFRLAEDGETHQGYTRYGAWYGNEYGRWDAMFVSFVLHYAGVPEDEFPEAAGVYAWSAELKGMGLYTEAADCTAVTAGDIIFFDNDGDGQGDHIGIVEEVSGRGEIKVIEGDSRDAVEEKVYQTDDERIIGYGILPEQHNEEELEAAEADEADVSAAGGSSTLTEQTVQARIFSDASAVRTMTVSEIITLSGLLPENASAAAYPVDVKIGDMTILGAYDITIYDGNGYEFEPEDGRIHVTIANSAIRSALSDGANPVVCHINDETSELELVKVTSTEDGAVEFDAESFSIYIVGDDDKFYDTETHETVTVYTVNFYQYEFDASDADNSRGPNLTSTQYVAETDTLNEPAVPEYDHHVFDGWFTQMQTEAGAEPGSKFDFNQTLKANLDYWGSSYTLSEHHTVELYTDYDPVYYVSFMTEEEPVFGGGHDYVPYVFHINTYHENNSALDTSDAGVLYWQQFLQLEGETAEQATTYAVVDWYYYEDDEEHTEANRKYISSENLTDDKGIFHVTDDITLYPAVEGAIWMFFDMCITDPSEVYIEPSPSYVLAGTNVGNSLPDAERAGYIFDGWWTDETGGEQITQATTFDQLHDYAQYGEVTLYARWTPAKVGYTVNIWRQKATDGRAGLNQKTVQTGEQYEDYITYYDYAESITISADDAAALITGSANLSSSDFTYTAAGTLPGQTTTVDLWKTWTGYGWTTGNNGSDGSGAYAGFEYNQARTENDLAAVTVKPDGSTIINIFYDRVTVTYHFGTSSNADATGTLIGLYDTNTKVADDAEPGGTLNGWPSPGNRTQWHYVTGRSMGSNTYTGMSFLAKFALTENYSYRSNIVYFTSTSTSYSSTLYYYLEVTNPDTQLTSGSQTATVNGKTYVLDYTLTFGWGSSGPGPVSTSFNITDKYRGYTAVGFKTSAGGDYQALTSGNNPVSLGNNGTLYIFNDALKYTINLYSNHNGEQLVWNDTYKYGAPLSSADLPAELDAAQYGPAWYYQFTGTWWEDPTFTAEFIVPEIMPSNNLAAYADWELKDITITFVSAVESNLYDLLSEAYGVYDEDSNPCGVSVNDDGSFSIVIKASEAVDISLEELEAKYEEGETDTDRYTFVSWMKGTTLFNVTGRLYDDTTLVASWNDAQKEHHKLYYVINLDDYSGTKYYTDGVEHAVDAESGEELLALEQIFNMENTGEELSAEQIAKFICWNTEPDGSGTDYYPDDLYSFANAHTDVVLYAKWAVELESVLHVHYNYPEGYDETRADEYPDVDITLGNLGTVDLSKDDEENNIFFLHEGDEIVVHGVTYRFVGWSTSEDAHTLEDVEIPTDAMIAVDGTDTDAERVNDLYAVWLAELTFSVEKTDTAGDQLEGAVFTLSFTRMIDPEVAGGDQVTVTYYLSSSIYTGDEGDPAVTYEWKQVKEGEEIPQITLGSISFTDHNGDLDGSEIFTLTEIAAPDGYLIPDSAFKFILSVENSDVQIIQNVSGHNSLSGDLAYARGTALTVQNEGSTCPVDIFKYTGDWDSGEITALPGAQFVLSRTVTVINEESGEETEEIYYGVFEKTEAESETYGGTICWFTFTSWTESASDATTLISGADGFVHMAELESGSYFLTEIKSPDGYILLDEAVQFTVFAGGYVTEDTVINAGIYKDRDIITLYIGNDPGIELPSTGSLGTRLFTLAGLVIMGSSACLLSFRKWGEMRAKS